MKKFNYGTRVKIKTPNLIGRVVRFYEKSEKYVVNVGGKLYTNSAEELKIVKDDGFLTKLLKKYFS